MSILNGRTLEVRVPASSANLGPGFDCIGIALGRYTTLRIQDAPHTEIIPLGDTLAETPRDTSNFVYQTMQALFERVGRDMPHLRLEIESDIPLARGMGSSAAALVAGLVAANVYLGQPLSESEIMDLASFLEGHPDNVGAALYGGSVVATFDGSRAVCARFKPNPRLAALLVIPNYKLSTEKARGVLPGHYSKEDTVHALSHAALLAASLASGDLGLLKDAMQDRIHQPYRAPLVAGLPEILQSATTYGALGAALSGAGPSVLCLYDREDGKLEMLQGFLQRLLETYSFDASLHLLDIPTQGAVWELQ